MLVSEAELIVVGRVIALKTDEGAVRKSATGEIERPIIVRISAVRMLKGKHPLGVVEFGSSPAEAAGLTGPITQSRIGIFFLRRTGGALQTVNPYYPVLPANENGPAVAGEPLDKVIGELAQLLDAEGTSEQDFRLAVYILKRVRHPLITDGLKRAAGRENAIGLLALSELLARGDISLLARAEQVLTAQTHYDAGVVKTLGESLSGINDPSAVPVLSRMLRNGGVGTRRAAATALGNTRSQKAIPALGEALYDADQEVRYHAVIALEEIRRQGHWAMSFEYFQGEEERLLESWRNWVKVSAKP